MEYFFPPFISVLKREFQAFQVWLLIKIKSSIKVPSNDFIFAYLPLHLV